MKGYSQKPGFDYEEAFSPITMLKSIIILLPIAAHLDYEIWQIDVKIAFLNDDLNKNIYMMQSGDFIENNKEYMVCKLHKSIYGLKQVS